jgi:hypothetical protein
MSLNFLATGAQRNWVVYHYLLCSEEQKEAFVSAIINGIGAMKALGFEKEPLYQDYTTFLAYLTVLQV